MVRLVGLAALGLAFVAGATAGSLDAAEEHLGAAYDRFGELYQGGFRHLGRSGDVWEFRGREGGRAVGELHISEALVARHGFQEQMDAAGGALDQAAGELEGPMDYARHTRAVTDYNSLVDYGNVIRLQAHVRGQSTPEYPLLEEHQTKPWAGRGSGPFDAAEFRQLAEVQLQAIEEASDTVPLLSCDSDANTGYHEVSNHFTNILHTQTPQDFAGERIDPKKVGRADPYEAMGVKETAWEILEPALRFKGARNATRAYLLASGSSRPAPEFALPIQGADLLGYKMADWETLVSWAQVVRMRFGSRSPQRHFYMLRGLTNVRGGLRDTSGDYLQRHIFPEPAGGTVEVAVDREASRELPAHPVFESGPIEVVPGGFGDEGGHGAPFGIPG